MMHADAYFFFFCKIYNIRIRLENKNFAVSFPGKTIL